MHDLLKHLLSRAMPIVLLMVFFLFTACSDNGRASVYTPFDELTFEDPVLKACVLAEAKRHDWQRSGQMTRLVCTNAEGAAVQSLQGIENLVNLQLLDLAHNEIADIHLIDRLERLTQLDLGYNRIRNAELSRLRISLSWLNLDHNEIAEVSSLAGLRHLETLSMSHNRLRDIESIARLKDLK